MKYFEEKLNDIVKFNSDSVLKHFVYVYTKIGSVWKKLDRESSAGPPLDTYCSLPAELSESTQRQVRALSIHCIDLSTESPSVY